MLKVPSFSLTRLAAAYLKCVLGDSVWVSFPLMPKQRQTHFISMVSLPSWDAVFVFLIHSCHFFLVRFMSSQFLFFLLRFKLGYLETSEWTHIAMRTVEPGEIKLSKDCRWDGHQIGCGTFFPLKSSPECLSQTHCIRPRSPTPPLLPWLPPLECYLLTPDSPGEEKVKRKSLWAEGYGRWTLSPCVPVLSNSALIYTKAVACLRILQSKN